MFPGLPDVLKRIESRIALAIAEAKRALFGIQTLAHNVSSTNGAPLGPAGTLTWTGPGPFTTISGRVLVQGQLAIANGGGTLVAGDGILAGLTRDGAGIPSATDTCQVAAEGTVAPLATVSAMWIDVVAPGSTHTWAISAIIGSAHTAGVGVAQATLTLIDLPASA